MKQPRARLLVFNDPRSMRIDSALAKEIGFEDSIVLLQLEYLIGISQHEHDGRLWTFQSLRNLSKEQFPWWSAATLSRIIKRLAERELIVIGNFNKTEWDKTQWFALNETGIAKLKSVCLAPDPFQIETPPVSKRNIDVSKMKHRYDQNETTIPKTTTETTQSGGVADTSQTTPPPLIASQVGQALVSIGLTENQTRLALTQRLITMEEVERIRAWLKTCTAHKPMGVLWMRLKVGLLPDDLPPAPKAKLPPIEFETLPDGRKRPKNPADYARINGSSISNPGGY